MLLPITLPHVGQSGRWGPSLVILGNSIAASAETKPQGIQGHASDLARIAPGVPKTNGGLKFEREGGTRTCSEPHPASPGAARPLGTLVFAMYRKVRLTLVPFADALLGRACR